MTVGEGAPDAESLGRKERSIEQLQREGVPYIDHLPAIESSAEVDPRSTEEVAARALALSIVAAKGESGDHELALKLVSIFRVEAALSPNERDFIYDPEPSQHTRIQFTWRYEGFGVLLWALNFVQELPRPDAIIDAEKAVSVPATLGRERFLQQASLRPISEILDAADLIYRYHWAVVEARLQGNPSPAGLDPGVVLERHYALNWLIRYLDQEWDDVSTDT